MCARARRALLPAAGLAVLAAAAAPGALAAADGRSGLQLGCSAVTDGRGGAVSGREGGASVSTRVQRECGQAPRAQPQARRTPPRTQPEAPAAVTRTVPIPVRTEPVSLPRAAEGTPSALSGDLVRASATVVTGGVLIWFLQSSFWASLLLLGVPIWRHVDLLPVLSQATDAGEVQRSAASEGQEDAALANVLDTGEAGAGTHGPRGLPA